MPTKINEHNYPILKEIAKIQTLKKDSDVEIYKHLEFLPLKHASSYDFVESRRKDLTAMIYLAGKSLEVDYLVYKLFAKLDNDAKFREKCFGQATLIPTNKTGCLLLPQSNKCIIYNTVSEEESSNGRKQVYVYFTTGNKIDSFEVIEIDADSKIYTENKYNVYTLKSAPALATSYYIVAYLIFKNYATIESVEMVSKTRSTTKTFNQENYKAETNVSITIIDSSWFREIKGDGFTVSGHLRFQYYPSTKTHKLIAIDAYEKTGYTRKAKKEDYDSQN